VKWTRPRTPRTRRSRIERERKEGAIDIGGFNPGDVQQYLERTVGVAEDNGAPEQVLEQMRNRLPEGEIPGPGDVTNVTSTLGS